MSWETLMRFGERLFWVVFWFALVSGLVSGTVLMLVGAWNLLTSPGPYELFPS